MSSFFIICLIVSMVAGVASADQKSDNSQNSPGQINNASERAGPGMTPDQKGPREMRSQNGTSGEMGHPPDFTNNSQFRENLLSDLESKGIDTTELRAAMESGDQEKIRQLMDSFRDKLPDRPQNGTSGSGFDGKEQRGNLSTQGSHTDKVSGVSGTAPTSIQSVKQSQPVPTPTKSPLSPIAIILGIGIAGLAFASIKRN